MIFTKPAKVIGRPKLIALAMRKVKKPSLLRASGCFEMILQVLQE